MTNGMNIFLLITASLDCQLGVIDDYIRSHYYRSTLLFNFQVLILYQNNWDTTSRGTPGSYTRALFKLIAISFAIRELNERNYIEGA